MKLPKFSKLRITTSTIRAHLNMEINTLTCFALIPIAKNKMIGGEIPFIEGNAGCVYSLSLKHGDVIYYRGIERGKAFRNAVSASLGTSTKNVFLKLSKKTIHLTGINSEENGNEAIQLTIDMVLKIQDILNKIQENMEYAEEVITWIHDNCRGKKTKRKTKQMIGRLEIHDKEDDHYINIPTEGLNEEIYDYFISLATDQKYLSLLIEKLKHILSIKSIIDETDDANIDEDLQNANIENSQDVSAENSHGASDEDSQDTGVPKTVNDVSIPRTVNGISTPRTLQPSEKIIDMINYNFSLNNKIDCGRLDNEFTERGFLSQYDPRVSHFMIRLFIPPSCVTQAAKKVKNAKKKSMDHKFLIYSSGRVTLSGKISEAEVEIAYNKFNVLMREIL